MPTSAIQVLHRRRREAGGTPLITYYDLGSGERTELSAITFGTWVDKTSNLLVDDLMVEPGDAVELALAASHPAHWVSLIWEFASWQVGLPVTLGLASTATVVVTGPEAGEPSDSPAHCVVCSLHPLGLGLRPAPPPPVVDYNTEVRLQPDAYLGAPAPADGTAWIEADRDGTPGRRLGVDDLTNLPAGPALRRLLRVEPGRSGSAWQAASALLDALSGGGSLVVVVGGEHEPERLERIVAQERVEGTTESTPPA